MRRVPHQCPPWCEPSNACTRTMKDTTFTCVRRYAWSRNACMPIHVGARARTHAHTISLTHARRTEHAHTRTCRRLCARVHPQLKHARRTAHAHTRAQSRRHVRANTLTWRTRRYTHATVRVAESCATAAAACWSTASLALYMPLACTSSRACQSVNCIHLSFT